MTNKQALKILDKAIADLEKTIGDLDTTIEVLEDKAMCPANTFKVRVAARTLKKIFGGRQEGTVGLTSFLCYKQKTIGGKCS